MSLIPRSNKTPGKTKIAKGLRSFIPNKNHPKKLINNIKILRIIPPFNHVGNFFQPILTLTNLQL